MRIGSQPRRGVTLLMVIFLMTIFGGLIMMLAFNRSYYYRSRQVNRVRSVARAVADSAAEYVRVHADQWKVDLPAEPIDLDVDELLLPKMTGSARLSLVGEGDRRTCRVTARVARGVVAVVDEIEIEIDG